MRRRDPRDYREAEMRDRGRDRFEGRMAQDSFEFRYYHKIPVKYSKLQCFRWMTLLDLDQTV